MRFLFFIWVLSINVVFADTDIDAINKILNRSELSKENYSLYIKNISKGNKIFSYNEHKAFNPASVMKLITTYAGLQSLGPQYQWKTEVLYKGTIKNNHLYGDLIIKGYGDPTLTYADLSEIIEKVQQQGIKYIHGNIIYDESFFGELQNQNLIDDKKYRAYNVNPKSFIVNENTVNFSFSINNEKISIKTFPEIKTLKVINHLKLTNQSCNDWKNDLGYDVDIKSNMTEIKFNGHYDKACESKGIDLSIMDANRLSNNLFEKLWKLHGGSIEGAFKNTYQNIYDMHKVYEHLSSPLSLIVRDINKYSQNLIARNLLLTILLENNPNLISENEAGKFTKEFLMREKVKLDSLEMDNGAGLSRNAKVSAEDLAFLLEKAYEDTYMPEFIASLPNMGVDGTLKNRGKKLSVTKHAYLKTGSIQNVNTIAGYIFDKNNNVKVFIFMANDPKANESSKIQDELIEWTYLN
ncbi:MAG: D-alanyl-D-alanine carboxypeptidase/D-alanyl-D-alanine-endopeptidase [Candidatus Methylopumilus sp.]|nr:D-alanyl-D-alanine carboxypeptidase/D-alanyl-D-alanine-endopeptidase [Candidatus Methylopumilus sp.]